MKFLFVQFSGISAALSIQNSSVLSDTYNMIPFLSANNSYVLTFDNILPNLSRKENFVTEHSVTKRKDKRSADDATILSNNQCFAINKMYNFADLVFIKVYAISNIKSIIEKTDDKQLFTYYSRRFSQDIYNLINNENIIAFNEPLSDFFDLLANKTYQLIYFAVVLDSQVEEEDKKILRDKLSSILDVKFKDEKSLEIKKFFDNDKLINFLDILIQYDEKTNGECKITKKLNEFKSNIVSEIRNQESTSTSDIISSSKLDSTTSTIKKVTKSPTIKKIHKKTKKPATLNVKQYKSRKNKEDTSENEILKYKWIILGSFSFVILAISIILFVYFYKKNSVTNKYNILFRSEKENV